MNRQRNPIRRRSAVLLAILLVLQSAWAGVAPLGRSVKRSRASKPTVSKRAKQRASKSVKATSAKAAPVASEQIATVQPDAEQAATTQPNREAAAPKDAKDAKKEGEATEEAKDE